MLFVLLSNILLNRQNVAPYKDKISAQNTFH